MTLASVGRTIQDFRTFTAIRESAYVYPVILSTHVACIAVSGGLILLTNLRLLEWSLTDVPVHAVIERFRPWKQQGRRVRRAAHEEGKRRERGKVWPATVNGVKDWLANQPDATATSDAVSGARFVPDRTRYHATADPIETPIIMCAVSVADAIAGPPSGARSIAVAAAPDSI